MTDWEAYLESDAINTNARQWANDNPELIVEAYLADRQSDEDYRLWIQELREAS